MNELLVLYNERLNLLRINRPLGLPLSLKLFDLRIKLAISIISLSYDTNIFLTKMTELDNVIPKW